MKRLKNVGVIVLMVSLLLPIGSECAQVPAKKSLPQVPITYLGDTDETMIRRAQWIEGAKKEGAIDWWGILSPEEGSNVAAEFNKIYPFIKVNYWRGRPAELATKLEAEYSAGRSSVDITQGGEPQNFPRWRKMGIFEKITDIIPGIERMPKSMYSKSGDWAIPGNNASTPQFNTKLVSEAEAPKRWEDLLDPKWKGQLAITPMVTSWYTLALADGGWGIKKTEEFLTKLKEQKPIYASSHTAAHSLLVAGEYKIVADGFVFRALQSQEKGMPGDWCRVSPIPISGPSFALQRKAGHPNAAKLFLEWLFSPQGLVAYEKITYYGAVYPNSGTKLSKALQGLTFIYRTEEIELKASELGLDKKYTQLLGITP